MSLWDETEGVDYDDPHHSTFEDRMYEEADRRRKAEREALLDVPPRLPADGDLSSLPIVPRELLDGDAA